MIEWSTAHQIASAYIATIPLAEDGDQAVIDDRYTVAYDFGWFFVFQSSWYLQTGDRRWQLYDNHPFVVERRDGRLIEVSIAHRFELLERFQQQWHAGLALA